MKKIISAIKLWLWDIPTAKPPKEQPVRLKATEVEKGYMVITYHGQRVNLHRILEYPIWKTYSRNEKRATANGFKEQERKGLIRFEIIEGKLICLKNKQYGAKTDVK
jgi:hypothetical protein